MNIIQLKPAADFPSLNGDAGHYELKASNGLTVHYAYFVLARMQDWVAVVVGSSMTKMSAIDHLGKQMKLLQDYADIVWHGAFWPIMEADQQRRNAAIREALGHADPAPPKADPEDGGGSLAS